MTVNDTPVRHGVDPALPRRSAEGPAALVSGVPLLYASNAFVAHTSNEYNLVFSRAHPTINPQSGIDPVWMLHPVAIIQMSPQAAKDFYLLLKKSIEQYEAVAGEIRTEYVRSNPGSGI